MSLEEKMIQETRRIVIERTIWLTLVDLADKLGKSSEVTERLLDKWERRGQIFCVTSTGKKLYAAYQFDANFVPLPIIEEILVACEPEDSWKVATWLTFPNGWLSYRNQTGEVVPVAPRDAFDRKEDLLYAAKQRNGAYME